MFERLCWKHAVRFTTEAEERDAKKRQACLSRLVAIEAWRLGRQRNLMGTRSKLVGDLPELESLEDLRLYEQV